MQMHNINKDTLEELYITDDTEVIDVGIFFGCPMLKKIVLGPNVKIVESGAFASCPKLETIEYSPNTIFEQHAFNNDNNIKTIKCGDQTFKAVYLETHSYFLGILDELSGDSSLYKGGFVGVDKLLCPSSMSHQIIFLGSILKNGIEYTWFSENPTVAMVATRYKASGLSFNDFFQTTLDEKSELNWPQFEVITGICYGGRLLWDLWAKHKHIDSTGTMSVGLIRECLGEEFSALMDRLDDAILYQDQPFNWLDYQKLYPGRLFITQYKQFCAEHEDWLNE